MPLLSMGRLYKGCSLHILAGQGIYRNIINLGNIADITVDGLPATINNITKTVYNFSCACAGDYTPVEDFKIFDITFDNTFE